MKKKETPSIFEFRVSRYDSGFIQIYTVIDCSDLIDYYSYHDAPMSVTWYPDKKELIKLKVLVDDALLQYEELEKENKHG